MFLVVRHTRAEEESGRAELLRATVTGRHAATAAAVLVAAAASVLVGVLDAAVLLANDLPAEASLLHGAELTGVGLVFTAVAAAAAQVTAGARAALGIAGAVLGATFLLRGIGDVGEQRPDLPLAARLGTSRSAVRRCPLVADPPAGRGRSGAPGAARRTSPPTATRAPA